MATTIVAHTRCICRINSSLKAIGPIVALLSLAAVLAFWPSQYLFAQGPDSLTNETPPPVKDILNNDRPLSFYVKDTQAAIEFGKAAFWDMQAGSDGQACASCHFHAGADNRTKNQLSTGFLGGNAVFDPSATTDPSVAGANYTLKKGDYPFHQKVDINNRSEAPSNVAFDTDDVTSSQGVIERIFNDIILGSADEDCTLVNPDSAGFHINNTNTRRVEPRNTPTTINAALNFANFWDGRANNIFNGVDPFGKRNQNAFILEKDGGGTVSHLVVGLENSSLASQAVGPPGSAFESSCGGRPMAKVGKKLLALTPLGQQLVDPNDSVLGSYSNAPLNGLNKTYQSMIEAAFANQYWQSNKLFDINGTEIGSGPPANTNQYTMTEFNFSFFWGLAIQLYEGTLISANTPFDHWVDAGRPPSGVSGFGSDEIAGLDVFENQGKCVNCHDTAMFTKASTLHLLDENAEEGLVERMLMGAQNRGPALYDNGFYNIGVRPTPEDIGRGGKDPFNNDLSWTRQYKDMLRGFNVPDPFQVNECTFEIRFDDPNGQTPLDLDIDLVVLTASGSAGDLDGDGNDDPFPIGFEFVHVNCPNNPPSPTLKPEDPDTVAAANKQLQDDTIKDLRTAVDGAFKTATLRNVELTGPFFHNGGQATLEQVVEFYNRGGDFFNSNQKDMDPDITQLNLSGTQQKTLVAFMKGLTDDDVRCERAPFDHPQLFVPNGHPGDHNSVSGAGGVADESLREIAAVGASGHTGENCLIGFLEPININSFLQLNGVSSSYNGGVCPAGVFTYNVTFLNTQTNTLFDIFSLIAEITGGNTILNAQGGSPTGGTGATVQTVLGDVGNSNGLLNTNETFTQNLDICLQSFNPFTLFIDEHGVVE